MIGLRCRSKPQLDGELQAPIEEGQRLGTVTITRTDTETPQELARIELTSPRSYKRSALLYGFHQFQLWVKAHTVFFGLTVLGLVLCLILIRDYRRNSAATNRPGRNASAVRICDSIMN